MARRAFPALAAAAALAAAGCGTSACQTLGEQLCQCQPGMTKDTCTSQVQTQLQQLGVDRPGFTGMLDNLSAGKPVTFEAQCQATLDTCVAPAGANFCEWLLTADGKANCGLSP